MVYCFCSWFGWVALSCSGTCGGQEDFSNWTFLKSFVSTLKFLLVSLVCEGVLMGFLVVCSYCCCCSTLWEFLLILLLSLLFHFKSDVVRWGFSVPQPDIQDGQTNERTNEWRYFAICVLVNYLQLVCCPLCFGRFCMTIC